MTTLDTRAQDVRTRAAAVQLPKPSTMLVALVGLLPFLLGWTLNVVWQFVRLLVGAFLSGWESGPAKPRAQAVAQDARR